MTVDGEVAVAQQRDGVCFGVKAFPGSKSNGLKGVHDALLKVAVTAAPEKGKANKAIIAVLAQTLGLKKNQLSIVSGATASRKQIVVQEIALEELRRRIAAATTHVDDGTWPGR